MIDIYHLVVIVLVSALPIVRQTDATSTWMVLNHEHLHRIRYQPFDTISTNIIHQSLWGRRKQSRNFLSIVPRGGSTDDDSEEVDSNDNEVDTAELDTKNNTITDTTGKVDIQQQSVKDSTESTDEDDDDDEEGDEEDDNAGVEVDDDEESNESGNEVEMDDVQIELNVNQYDEPYVASPMTSMYVSLGVMMLGRKVDLLSPPMVRIARFIFITYIILHQCFLFYVRIQAKTINDRTPIQLTNPLSSLIQNQLFGGAAEESGGANGMIKSLASSFLSSTSTVLDYDLKQARGMQSGLIFNMLFMWFLHFKMGQVQPLLIQTLNGVTAMVYSPLFQIYVLGRNLERPFKTNLPPKPKSEEESQSDETVNLDGEEGEADGDDDETTYVEPDSNNDDTDEGNDDDDDDDDESEIDTEED